MFVGQFLGQAVRVLQLVLPPICSDVPSQNSDISQKGLPMVACVAGRAAGGLCSVVHC
jgi:hypothetical protein